MDESAELSYPINSTNLAATWFFSMSTHVVSPQAVEDHPQSDVLHERRFSSDCDADTQRLLFRAAPFFGRHRRRADEPSLRTQAIPPLPVTIASFSESIETLNVCSHGKPSSVRNPDSKIECSIERSVPSNTVGSVCEHRRVVVKSASKKCLGASFLRAEVEAVDGNFEWRFPM